jgi:hypothetical protein
MSKLAHSNQDTMDEIEQNNRAAEERGERSDPPDRKIIVHFVFPPIPSRAFDYCAMYDGDELATGYGETREQAIADLLDNYPANQPTWRLNNGTFQTG